MPDETVWRTMLFDFYGDLLTDKQREYYDLHYNQDLSLAEIAASSGISRQGVWDNIRRADAALRDRPRPSRTSSSRTCCAMTWCGASPRSVQPRPRWRIRSRSCATPSAATLGCWPSGRCGSFRI